MSQPRKWFTADPHFGSDARDILKREMRPFTEPEDYAREQVRIWNGQAGKDDTIYVIGDFCNCNSFETDFRSGLAVSRRIDAHLILITGNNEDRVVELYFGGSFERFRDCCMREYGFDDVKRNGHTETCGQRFFLTHRPVDHAKDCLTLFGHTHRSTGLWKPFGFNVGVDLGHFRLFGDEELGDLLAQKCLYWDRCPDVNCLD